MASLGSLVVSLAMDTAKFRGDIGKATQQMHRMSEEAGKLGAAVGLWLAAAAGAGVVMVRQSIDAADAQSKLAQKVGITVEEVSALAYAASLSDVSNEALGSSLVRLARNASDTANGVGEAKDAFAAMNIGVKQGDGTLKSTGQLLTEVAEKFAGYRDGAGKTALATMLFGKAGADLIPLLNSGASGLAEMTTEARMLGLEISTNTAKSAEEFNDNLTRLSAVKTGLANGIMSELVPTLANLSDELFNSAKQSGGLAAAAKVAANGVKILLSVGVVVGEVFRVLGQALGGVAATIMALFTGEFKQAFEIGKSVVSDFAENMKGVAADKYLSAIWDEGAAGIDAKSGPLSDKLAAPLVKTATKAANAARAIKSEAEKVYDEIEKRLASLQFTVDTQGASERIKGLIELTQKGAAPEQTQRYLSLTGAAEAFQRAQEAATQAAADQQAVLSEGRSLYESLRTPIEALADKQAHYNDLLAAGAINWDTYARATFAAQDAFDAAGKSALELDSYTKRLAKNTQDQLGSGLYDVMRGNFENIGDGFLSMLQRMSADALAAQLSRKIFGGAAEGGSGGGLIGSIGGWLGGLFKGGAGASAGVPSNVTQIHPMATGTNRVPYDGFLARLHKNEAVVPAEYNPAAGGAGSGMNVSIYNSASDVVQASAQRGSDGSLEIMVRRLVRDENARDVRGGGGVISSGLRARGLNLDGGNPKRG